MAGSPPTFESAEVHGADLNSGSKITYCQAFFIAPIRPGDTITGEVEVTKVREDKPISELDTRVRLSDGGLVLEGTVVCYTMPIG